MRFLLSALFVVSLVGCETRPDPVLAAAQNAAYERQRMANHARQLEKMRDADALRQKNAQMEAQIRLAKSKAQTPAFTPPYSDQERIADSLEDLSFKLDQERLERQIEASNREAEDSRGSIPDQTRSSRARYWKLIE